MTSCRGEEENMIHLARVNRREKKTTGLARVKEIICQTLPGRKEGRL